MGITGAQQKGVSAGFPFLSTMIWSICLFFVAVSIVSSAIAFFAYDHNLLWVLPPILSVAAAAVLLSKFKRVLLSCSDIFKTLQYANRGDFDRRITHTKQLGEIGKIAWEVNEFLDKVESYFKEVNSCFDQIAQGSYERYALYRGLPGLLKTSLKNINASIEKMKQNAELVAANELHSELHSLNTSNLISNLRDAQRDLINIGSHMESVESIAAQTGQDAQSGQQTVSAMVSALDNINATINEVAQVVTALGADSLRVQDSLSMIKDIADQTDLLALNAAIEAARAGEQGRGFAVVADEVKALSQRTKEAAVDVTETINSFTRRIGDTVTKVDISNEQSQEVNRMVQGFKDQFDEFSTGAMNTVNAVSKAKDYSLSSLVKVDHIVYKQNGYICLGNEETASEAHQAIAVDHHNCRLGKWYYEGEGKINFCHTEGYKALEHPHSRVHSAVQRAVAHSQQDWLNDADLKRKIIEAMKEAEKESYKILQHLDAMVSQRHKLQSRMTSSSDNPISVNKP